MKKILNTRGKLFISTNIGFTLIELLAVIVILAIISVIAVPIVLNIINDSKETSTIQSAQFYIDALKNRIMQENLKLGGTFIPSKCIVDSNGNVNCDEKYLEVEVKGEKPISGYIEIQKGIVSNIDITINDERVIKNDSGEIIPFPCILKSGDKNTPGSKYECEVKPGKKYNFYVLSQGPKDTTNLIMERNICRDGTVATSTNTCLVAWNSNGYSSKGPETAMAYLNDATSTWKNISNLNISYNEFIIKGKARLPRYDEINETDAFDKCLLSTSDGNNKGSCPIWLANYLNSFTLYTSENGKVDVANIWGYWILDSLSDQALYVHYYGDIGTLPVETNNYIGVRPVINIKL